MRNDIIRKLEEAAKIALKGQKRSYRLGSIGIRNDGTMVSSFNSPTRIPNPCAHSEFRLAKKLDQGAVVYVARILKSGELAMARPCRNCMRALMSRRVKRIYYSISPNEFGCIQI